MKKTFVLFAAAVAALLTVSCVKETANDNLSQAGMKKVTITASVEETTKTTYSETGAFSWTKGDKVSVLGDDKNFYTLTAVESGAKVEFTGEVPAGVELTGKAFYPADEFHACIRKEGKDYDSYEYNIPEYKDLTAAFSADLPMGSYTDGDGVYSFKHMTGAALLTFSNLDDYTAVEITLFNASLKFSGIFEPYINDDDIWVYGSKGAPAGGSKFIRKVSVVDGVAQVYLPYASDIWANTLVDMVGYGADGKEYELLKERVMRANGTKFERATVIPYSTLNVPTYVAPTEKEELKDVNWANENVITYILPETEVANVALTETKVLATKQFVNVRVKCSAAAFAELQSPAMSVFLFDGDPEGKETYYGFWTTTGKNVLKKEHRGKFNGTELSLEVNGAAVETITSVSDTEITWSFAIPRDTVDQFASADGKKVYFGVLLDEGWGQVGAAPVRGEAMLEISLP